VIGLDQAKKSGSNSSQMQKPFIAPTPSVHILRCAVLIFCWFVFTFVLALLLDQTFALPPDSRWSARLHGALFGGGIVLLIAVINLLLRRGRLKWLVKE